MVGREFPGVPFERYADDAILHCASKQQAQIVLDAIVKRLAQVRLELNLEKTRIVYCKDSNRTGSHEHERFDFLGYTSPSSARQRRRDVRQLLSGDLERRCESDPRNDSTLAAAPTQQRDPQ